MELQFLRRSLHQQVLKLLFLQGVRRQQCQTHTLTHTRGTPGGAGSGCWVLDESVSWATAVNCHPSPSWSALWLAEDMGGRWPCRERPPLSADPQRLRLARAAEVTGSNPYSVVQYVEWGSHTTATAAGTTSTEYYSITVYTAVLQSIVQNYWVLCSITVKTAVLLCIQQHYCTVDNHKNKRKCFFITNTLLKNQKQVRHDKLENKHETNNKPFFQYDRKATDPVQYCGKQGQSFGQFLDMWTHRCYTSFCLFM